MFINVVIIVVMMLIGVGATGLCTYNPGRPENGPVQEVDARTFLSLESRATNFPIRYPEMPEGWVTNSARRTMIDQQPAPVVGWVTPAGGYLQMTQTGADLPTAIAAQDAASRPNERTVTVEDHDVQVRTSDDASVRPLWAVDAGDARFLITGAGSEDEFTALISAALKATPIDPNENS